MKNATELLTAYLAQIQDPAAAALFADDGVIELPWVNARAQGPVEIEKVSCGAARKGAGLPIPEHPYLDSDARPSLRRVRRRGACAIDRQDLSTDLRRTPRRGKRKDQTLARSARYQGCVTGIQ